MNKIKEIRFIDLFSGIGGFRLGLERSNNIRSLQQEDSQGTNSIENELDNGEYVDNGKEEADREHKISRKKQLWVGSEEGSSISQSENSTKPNFSCVWSNDVNKYANQIYAERFGEEAHYSGDIRGVDPKEIPKHDLLCGGFPCQAFSIAGKREGFKDTRGTLFFEICRITAYHRPELLLLENVKGLLSHDGGRTFATILYALEDLGYWWEYPVLNSKNYGVAQNRERVFIIGHLGTGSTRPIFPVIKSSKIINERNTSQQIASTLQSPGHAAGNYRGMNMIASRIPLKFLGRNERNWMKDEAYTIDSVHTGGVLQPIPELSNCLDTSGWLREMGRHEEGKHDLTDYRIRRLTPTECERLQGFPDGWTEGISDTQRYKCLGNAVTVNVIEFLGHKIRESVFSKRERTNT